jgi:hypothetical protein
VAPPSAEKACSQCGGGRVHRRPGEAHPDRPAGEGVVGVERADAVAKAPAHRRIERPERRPGVEVPDRPLARRGIERAQRHAADGVAVEGEDVVVDVAVAAEQRLGDRGAVELDPFAAAGEPLLQAPVPDLPAAEEEVEVAGPGPGGCRLRGHRVRPA